MTRLVCAILLVFAFSAESLAELRSKTVKYQDGDVELAGYLAWDDAAVGKRPGVLVVHEWWGLNDYARQRAEQLAKMGYVAFALDMYGKDKVAEHAREAGQWAKQIRQNVEAWRRRAVAGLDVLRSQKQVDGQRIAAIGYCFGGATVMQLAYGGEDLAGVVSFHGSLPVPSKDQAQQTKAKILVCHGAADGFVPEARIQKFRAALDDAGADWQMVYYAGARHSFTNPGADKHGIEGIKYDKNADARSWRHMQTFFDEILAR